MLARFRERVLFGYYFLNKDFTMKNGNPNSEYSDPTLDGNIGADAEISADRPEVLQLVNGAELTDAGAVLGDIRHARENHGNEVPQMSGYPDGDHLLS
jgi:hypothetical protein